MSRKTLVIAAAAFFGPAALSAQAPAAPSAPAAQPADAAGTHVVKPGDTLWALARHYLSDPFLWPQIYRLNTDVVEDPHWIYPGEVLRLTSGGGAVVSVPTVDTPAPPAPTASVDSAPPSSVSAVDSTVAAEQAVSPISSASAPGSEDWVPLFPTRTSDKVMRETLRAYTHQEYRPLRPSEFYSAGFLTERQKLPFGRVLGPVIPPQIRSSNVRWSATQFTTVAVEPPAGATYQEGDTLLMAALPKEIEGYGYVVMPTGLARVTEVRDGHTLATIVAQYDAIRNDQVVMPAEKFTPAGTERAAPVADGVRARIVGSPKRQELKVPQQFVFLSKGRQDGVAPGDIFEARRRPGKTETGQVRTDHVMATMQVVHVRDHTATAKLLNVQSPDIEDGSEARQVAKLP
jgi:hypothetical protein